MLRVFCRGTTCRLKPLILNGKTLVASVILVSLYFMPQTLLVSCSSSNIHSDLDAVPSREYGIVFGARVHENQMLSDAARERIEGAILLYDAGKIERLFISGDNRHNNEVDNIAQYALNRGIPEKDILTDDLGIDTHDTCKHFRELNVKEATLITQGFHLPRAMYMCKMNGIDGTGLAVNRLGLLESRGANVLQIHSIRFTRFVRESLLTWLFALGIYDRVSNEAEEMQRGIPD